MWNKIEAEVEFLRRVVKAPRLLRNDEQMRDALRQRVNHDFVDYSMKQYAACTLEELRPWAAQVFGLMFGLQSERNAEAISFTPTARMVRISPALIGTILMVVAAIDELQPQALADHGKRLAAAPKLIVPTDEAIRNLRREAAITAENIVPTLQAKELIRSLRAVREDPTITMRYYERFKLIRPGFAQKLDKAFGGVHFVLGHEIAHHLLSHGENVPEAERAPGPRILDEWLTANGIDRPLVPRPHLREHRADALALLLGSHTMGSLGQSGLLGASGSLVANLALSITDDDPADLDQSSRTHPSFALRCEFQAEIIAHVFGPVAVKQPRLLGREVSGKPVGYSLQVLFLCQVLAELLKKNPGSAFSRH